MTIDARPASCMPSSCLCEAIRDTGIRQPANTFSSLAFIVVALIVLARGANRTLALLFAFTLAFVGFGSAYYHATLSFMGQFLDVLGMYLLATLAIVLSNRKLSKTGMIGGYVLLNSALAVVLYHAPVFRRWIFALLLVMVVVLELRDRSRSKINLVRAISVMAIAFVVWLLDFTRVVCSPGSHIQGHAIWHVLGAFAGWLLFLHYRGHDARDG